MPSATVLDYGSGRGRDVLWLRETVCRAAGYDPYYSRGNGDLASDVVLLTYVLNVIEDPEERREVLRNAWRLAREALVVSVPVRLRRPTTAVRYGDGYLTRRRTFQLYWGDLKFRAYAEAVLGVPGVRKAPGVLFFPKGRR